MPNNSVFCHGVPGPGSHVSKYSFSWLADNYHEETKQSTIQPRILWNSDIYKNANIASAKWDTFMNSDDELKAFLHHYLLYGIAFVDDVPATVEATEAVSQRVSIIRYLYFFVLFIERKPYKQYIQIYMFAFSGNIHRHLWRFLSTQSSSTCVLCYCSSSETTYGKMWCFTSDTSRGDSAYTPVALDRHTDTTYFQEPCG